MRTRRVSHLPVAKGTKQWTPRLQSTVSLYRNCHKIAHADGVVSITLSLIDAIFNVQALYGKISDQIRQISHL